MLYFVYIWPGFRVYMMVGKIITQSEKNFMVEYVDGGLYHNFDVVIKTIQVFHIVSSL